MAGFNFKRAMAIFGLCTYTFDVGSDIWVTFDLFQRCHYSYATMTVALIALPGYFFGWNIFVTEKNLPFFLLTLFGPVSMIPITLYYQIKNVIQLNSDTEKRR